MKPIQTIYYYYYIWKAQLRIMPKESFLWQLYGLRHYIIIFGCRSFPEHFNESTMFSGGSQAMKLKEEFSLHFRNISAIMDCVGCDKCKLWGKLQVFQHCTCMNSASLKTCLTLTGRLKKLLSHCHSHDPKRHIDLCLIL